MKVVYYSPPIPSNRVSAWVSGGSNYVYETNKSEREAETELGSHPGHPFLAGQKAITSSVSSRCTCNQLQPKTSPHEILARFRKSQMSTAVSFRSQANEAKCYAIEAHFEVVDPIADAAPPRLVALTW